MDAYSAACAARRRRALRVDARLRGRERQAEEPRVALERRARRAYLHRRRREQQPCAAACASPPAAAASRCATSANSSRHRRGLRRAVRLAGLPRAGAGRPPRQLPAAAPGASYDGLGNRRRHRDARAAPDARARCSPARRPRSAPPPNTQASRGRHRAAGRAAGAEPRRGRARDPLRPRGRRRRSTGARSSRARTTSIPTCPRATRSASTRCPIVQGGAITIVVERARRRSASRARTSRRTPASRCTRTSTA